MVLLLWLTMLTLSARSVQITELRNCWHSLLFMNGGFVYIPEFLPLLKVTITHWQLQLREIPGCILTLGLTVVSVSLSDNTLACAYCPILAITFKRGSKRALKRATSSFASIRISLYPSLPSATRWYSFSLLTFSLVFKSFNKLAVAPF